MSKVYTRELREPRPGEVASFLSRHGATKVEPQQNGELRFSPCPSCKNIKQSGRTRQLTCADVNPKTGLWRCFACGAKGNWLTLTRGFGAELPRDDRYKDQRPEDTWKLRSFFETQKRRPVAGGHYSELLAYCHARGVSSATLNAFLVTSCGPETLRWPMHAWGTGEVKGGWQMVNAKLKPVLGKPGPDGERAKSRFEKAGGPTGLLIGQHLIHARHGERVIIWEGEFDAMVAHELGALNSVSLPNGASSVHVGSLLRYIPDDWKIYLGMDMDKAGEQAVEAFFAQVDPKRLIRIALPAKPGCADKKPYKDLNDWWLGAGGLLKPADIFACAEGLGSAKRQQQAPAKLGSFLTKVEPQEAAEEGGRLVCAWPWPQLNAIFKGGLLEKQTTGFLAPSGIGKTTALNQAALHAAANHCITGLISLEDSREELHDNINRAAHGWLHPEQMVKAGERLLVSSLEGSAVNGDEILEEVERLAKDGARLIIVDNLDHTADRSDMRRGMSDKLTTYVGLIDLAKRLSLHIIVVWQCNKVDRGEVVNSGNQKGYGQTFLDAGNYINMNRLVNGGVERTRLEVEKARASGASLLSNHVWLSYVPSKRSFYEAKGNLIAMQGGGGEKPDLTTF